MRSSPGRNEPCHCGSGKKYKKCHLARDEAASRKERHAYIGHSEPFDAVQFKDGELQMVRLYSGEWVKPDHLFSQTTYPRASGKEKVVNRVLDKFAVETPSYLASTFDVVFAIDTNTKKIGADLVSLASVIECYARKLDTDRVEVSYRKLTNIAFKNCPEAAERFGWAKLLPLIPLGSPRAAIITDHDLGNHGRYNGQEWPIYADVFLPKNVTLIYASAEVGQEDITNFLVKQCEADSKDVLRQLEEGGRAVVGNETVTLDQIPSVSPRG